MRRGRVALALGSQSAISSSCPRTMESPQPGDPPSPALCSLGAVALAGYARRRRTHRA